MGFHLLTEYSRSQLARTPRIVAKPLMILCNVAERAIERDLGLKGLNSYHPRFQRDSAKALAGYLKPFLPDRIELESFCARCTLSSATNDMSRLSP
jgi:hypothetical protein